jgi:hypothetical protein
MSFDENLFSDPFEENVFNDSPENTQPDFSIFAASVNDNPFESYLNLFPATSLSSINVKISVTMQFLEPQNELLNVADILEKSIAARLKTNGCEPLKIAITANEITANLIIQSAHLSFGDVINLIQTNTQTVAVLKEVSAPLFGESAVTGSV